MDAGMLIRTDAAVEGALGVALVVGGASGALAGADFPAPVGRVVVVAVGALLLVLAAFLWRGRLGLQTLAVGNAVTAVAAVAWLAAASGFSAAGAALVGATIAALACLAAAQAAEVTTVRR